MIMHVFNLKPCSEIGIIKSRIKEAILEGEIPNQPSEAIEYMFQLGNELGLTKVNEPNSNN